MSLNKQKGDIAGKIGVKHKYDHVKKCEQDGGLFEPGVTFASLRPVHLTLNPTVAISNRPSGADFEFSNFVKIKQGSPYEYTQLLA